MIGAGAERDLTARTTPVGDLSALAVAAQGGDRRGTEALLERVRVIAHRYSWARLSRYPGGGFLADDVAQDICIAVLRALPRYRDQGRPFEAFVHGVASRKVADALRALARHPLPTDDLPERVDEAPTPEDFAIRSSEAASATELLDQLPDRLREVMVLRVGAGLTAEETGAALGMSAGAVRVAQHRALTKMRRGLERGQGVPQPRA
jgi:RNA polymerase sigma-70 factor (ECF subfamily)